MNGLPTPGAVLDYWIGPATHDHFAAERRNKRWFIKSADTDQFIVRHFRPLLDVLAEGLANDWAQAGPRQRLAAIIVLDQFSRNIYRGEVESFAFDELALDLALKGLSEGVQFGLTEIEQSFMFMPLEHSERLEHQDRCVDAFQSLFDTARPAFKPICQKSLDYAHQHRDVIRRFGRFPHRNAILGRPNTPSEVDYLARPGAGF
ncbi:MAG: DUF924 family protein [Henriciella sp.]